MKINKYIFTLLVMLVWFASSAQIVKMDVARLKAKTTTQMTAISNPVEGDQIYNTDTGTNWNYNGTFWTDTGSGGGPTGDPDQTLSFSGNDLTLTKQSGSDVVDISAIDTKNSQAETKINIDAEYPNLDTDSTDDITQAALNLKADLLDVVRLSATLPQTVNSTLVANTFRVDGTSATNDGYAILAEGNLIIQSSNEMNSFYIGNRNGITKDGRLGIRAKSHWDNSVLEFDYGVENRWEIDGLPVIQNASDVAVSPAVNALVDVQTVLEDHETRLDNISAGSGITGTISDNQVAMGDGTDNIGGDAGFTFDGTSLNTAGVRIDPTFTNFTGRLAVGGNPSFGGSRLGNSELQTPSLDIGSAINFMGPAQEARFAIFENNDILTMRSLGGNKVGVLDLNGGNQAVWGTDDAEATFAATIDYTDGKIFVNDIGVQNYPSSGTVVAQKFFQVLQNRGGAPELDYWFGRYDGTTYSEILSVNDSEVIDFAQPPTVNGNPIGWESSVQGVATVALMTVDNTVYELATDDLPAVKGLYYRDSASETHLIYDFNPSGSGGSSSNGGIISVNTVAEMTEAGRFYELLQDDTPNLKYDLFSVSSDGSVIKR